MSGCRRRHPHGCRSWPGTVAHHGSYVNGFKTTRYWPAGSRAPSITTGAHTARWWPAGAPPPSPSACTTSSTIPTQSSSHANDINTARDDRNHIHAATNVSIDKLIKTVTEEIVAALAHMQKLATDTQRLIEDWQYENRVLHKGSAETTTTIDVLEKTSPSLPTLPEKIGCGARHPFSVTHYDADVQYFPQHFHERMPTTQTCSPKPSSPTPPTSTPTSVRTPPTLLTSTPASTSLKTLLPPGLSRCVPKQIVDLLDEKMAELSDLDLECLDGMDDIVTDALDAIYEETSDLEFWDDDEGFVELDRLLQTKYLQHKHSDRGSLRPSFS